MAKFGGGPFLALGFGKQVLVAYRVGFAEALSLCSEEVSRNWHYMFRW